MHIITWKLNTLYIEMRPFLGQKFPKTIKRSEPLLGTKEYVPVKNSTTPHFYDVRTIGN